MGKSLQKTSEELLRLVSYVESLPDGAMIPYDQAENETGVKMDAGGKAKLNRAIRRCGRAASTFRRQGYRLADAQTGTVIVVGSLIKIDRTVRRADRIQKIIQDKFLAELSEEEQKGIIFVGALFGSIRLMAEQGRQLYGRKKVLALSEGKPIIPDVR